MPLRSSTALRTASAPQVARLRLPRPAAFAPGAAPRVWVLSSPRAGERTQLLALAEALGCPYEIKRIAHRPLGAALELLGGEHLARRGSASAPIPSRLRGPISCCWRTRATRWWPAGSAASPAAAPGWSCSAGPWAPVESFDLVVTTPQYELPEAANVLQNLLPLHGVTAERLADAAERWEPRLAHLPRPFVTVLVGGSSGPYVFDAQAAARLGREASELARSLGGSVLVSTSARTKPAAVDALFAAIDAPACLHRWSAADSQNPYFGFLGLADRIIVTADSISMIAEASATGRPVQMFDFGSGGVPMRDDAAVDAGAAPAVPPSRLALRGLHAAAARPAQSQPRPAHRASAHCWRRVGWHGRARRSGRTRCGSWATR